LDLSVLEENGLSRYLDSVSDDHLIVHDETASAYAQRWARTRRDGSSLLVPEASLRSRLLSGSVPKTILAASANREGALVDGIRSILSASNLHEVEVLGVKSDLHPYLLVAQRLQPVLGRWIDRHERASEAPEQIVGVLCAPRAGSYLLCDKLAIAGLGYPDEYLRDPVIAMCRDRGVHDFDLVQWLDRLMSFAARKGVVGVKLISHFIEKLLPWLEDRERSSLDRWLRRTRIIYLYRRDKVLQAMSNVRAQKTRTFGITATSEPAEVPEPTYEFSRVLQEYSFFLEQEALLLDYLLAIRGRLTQNVLILCYEDFERDVEGHIEWILSEMGRGAPRGLGKRLRVHRFRRMRGPSTYEQAEVFVQEYQEKFAGVPERSFDPLKDPRWREIPQRSYGVPAGARSRTAVGRGT
jgi:LPS sulfotransferase NodH